LLSNEGQISIVEEKDIIRYPAENIVKLLSPLSNENRIKILKLLFKDVKSSSELSKELRLEGGSLYHHIKELRIAGYIKEIERGKYASTLKGRIAIASIVAIAHIPAITSFS
ncbi:MAG TPA: ArsR family transcriptional regulator, partial [Thermofilum sp.]|nr:ArsR family transcriptional regulator [Thermofilum sp.]